jgi:hypothetical protein
MWPVASDFFLELPCFYKYCILLSIVCTFFIEYDAKILRAHYTWKVGFTNLIHKQSIQVKRVKLRFALYSYAHHTG